MQMSSHKTFYKPNTIRKIYDTEIFTFLYPVGREEQSFKEKSHYFLLSTPTLVVLPPPNKIANTCLNNFVLITFVTTMYHQPHLKNSCILPSSQKSKRKP